MASEITFYKVDQKPGDLIVLPPMAPHQVYNKVKKAMTVFLVMSFEVFQKILMLDNDE